MVQVAGVTYRIACTRPGSYELTRILDDVLVGTLLRGSQLRVTAAALTESEVRQIALAAIRAAKISDLGRPELTVLSPEPATNSVSAPTEAELLLERAQLLS